MVGKEIRKVSRGCHYFFVKPRQNGDVKKAVERLMEIREVMHVSITEGEYGFVVSAKDAADGETVRGRINRAVGGRSAMATCHCHYVRC